MASFCNILQRNNTKGIMCIDTNSWSTLWNSDSTNARGHLMDKWILGNNLDILNTEKTPTFLTSRAQSIIDVSLAYKAKNHISNWHVKNQHFFSDHRCIQFILFSKEFVPPTVQVTSWPSFRNALNLEEKRYKLWTRSIIEREAEALEGAINTALAASSANIPLRSNPTHFWNNDLEKSRRLSLNLDRHMQNRPSSSVKSDFENAKKSHFKAVRKARRKSWQSFINDVNNPKKMATLNRILKSNNRSEIGLIKNQNGVYSKSVLESLDILLETHFPESVPLEADEHTKSVNTQEFFTQDNDNIFVNQQSGSTANIKAYFCSENDLKNSIVNEKSVKFSINSFEEGKAPGADSFKPKILQEFIKNDVCLRRLTRLLAAVLEIGYTPQKWCVSKIIFIPKPGKTDYGEAKSYRPI